MTDSDAAPVARPEQYPDRHKGDAALDVADLRDYAGRDWGAPERMAREPRAKLPVAQKVRLAIDLYEAARATRPDWPSDAIRRADLATHRRVRALLDRAAHVGRR